VGAIAFSSGDSRRAVIGCADGSVQVLAIRYETGRSQTASPGQIVGIQQVVQVLTLREHNLEVTSVMFSKDGRNVLTASRDNRIIVWPSASVELQNTDLASASVLEGDEIRGYSASSRMSRIPASDGEVKSHHSSSRSSARVDVGRLPPEQAGGVAVSTDVVADHLAHIELLRVTGPGKNDEVLARQWDRGDFSVLNNLTGLFARLRNGHYRLKTVRQGQEPNLILDFYLRNGILQPPPVELQAPATARAL